MTVHTTRSTGQRVRAARYMACNHVLRWLMAYGMTVPPVQPATGSGAKREGRKRRLAPVSDVLLCSEALRYVARLSQLDELIALSREELAAAAAKQQRQEGGGEDADDYRAGGSGDASSTGQGSGEEDEDDNEDDEDDFRDMGSLSASELAVAEAAAQLLAAAEGVMRAVSRPLLQGVGAGSGKGKGVRGAQRVMCTVFRASPCARQALDSAELFVLHTCPFRPDCLWEGCWCTRAFVPRFCCIISHRKCKCKSTADTDQLTASLYLLNPPPPRLGPPVTPEHCLDDWESMGWHAGKLRSGAEGLVATLYPPHEEEDVEELLGAGEAVANTLDLMLAEFPEAYLEGPQDQGQEGQGRDQGPQGGQGGQQGVAGLRQRLADAEVAVEVAARKFREALRREGRAVEGSEDG